jgi:PAS domain S-box-containing protein
MHTPLAQQPENVRQQPPADAAKPERAWSLKAHLLVFGLALVLPILTLAGFLLVKINNSSRAELEQRMVQIAAGVVADVDREMQHRITVLQTLAISPALARGDFATFHAHASAVLHEDKAGIFVIDPVSFQQLLNTYVPFGTELPTYGSPETAQRVLETKRWQISNFFIGRVSKRPAFDLAVPIFKDGAIQYILVMGLEPFMLQQILRARNLPTDWVIDVADRGGTILVRSTDHEKYVGTKLPPDLLAQRTAAIGRVVSLEGVPALSLTATSQLSGWQIAIKLPVAAVEEPLKQGLFYLGLWSAVALLLTILIASWFGRTMARPIAAAADATVDLAHRRAIPSIKSHISEANTLIDAIKRAARELSSAEETRRVAEEQQRSAYHRLEEEKAQTATLLQQREAIFAAMPNGVLVIDHAGRIHLLNEELAREFGYQHRELLGQNVEKLVPARFRGHHAALRKTFMADPSPRPMGAGRDLFGLRKDGSEIPIEIGLSPFTVDEREMVLAIVINIAERKRAEEAEELLSAELQHRTKNLFAVVQAIAVRTLRGDPALDDVREAFVGGLQALARSDHRLTQTSWSGASLRNVIESELEHFSDRIRIDGPEVVLAAQMAQNFALAIHELATNAAKYGSLSKPGGEVIIGWAVANNGAGEALQFRWQERGGPPVVPPKHKGLGTSLLESTLGKGRVEYRADGLVYEIEAPLSDIN